MKSTALDGNLKYCNKCDSEKSTDDFYKTKTGLHSYCKSCWNDPIKMDRKEFPKMEEGLKRCRDCGEAKPHSEYHRHKYTSDGCVSYCKACWNKRKRDAYVPQPRERQTPEFKSRMVMLNAARQRAKKKGLPFNIGVKDIIIPTHCPVFGFELRRAKQGEDKSFSPSLDRLLPELGYIPGNVVVVSLKANVMKNNGTLEDIKSVYNFYTNLYNEIAGQKCDEVLYS